MAVYVDSYFTTYRKMKMCHMVADTLSELHEMADKLGLRRYFQDKTRYPHYDICLSKRALALKLGAIECDRKTVISCAKALKVEMASSEAGAIDEGVTDAS